MRLEDILFEILLQNEYKGALPNGIKIDMEINEVEQIEPSLKYDDEFWKYEWLKNTLRNNIQRYAKEDDTIILSIDAFLMIGSKNQL